MQSVKNLGLFQMKFGSWEKGRGNWGVRWRSQESRALSVEGLGHDSR